MLSLSLETTLLAWFGVLSLALASRFESRHHMSRREYIRYLGLRRVVNRFCLHTKVQPTTSSCNQILLTYQSPPNDSSPINVANKDAQLFVPGAT